MSDETPFRPAFDRLAEQAMAAVSNELKKLGDEADKHASSLVALSALKLQEAEQAAREAEERHDELLNVAQARAREEVSAAESRVREALDRAEALAQEAIADAEARAKAATEVAEFEARQPMGRLGKPEEIAALALHLASDESGFTTGQIHIIDGGWMI